MTSLFDDLEASKKQQCSHVYSNSFTIRKTLNISTVLIVHKCFEKRQEKVCNSVFVLKVKTRLCLIINIEFR